MGPFNLLTFTWNVQKVKVKKLDRLMALPQIEILINSLGRRVPFQIGILTNKVPLTADQYQS